MIARLEGTPLARSGQPYEGVRWWSGGRQRRMVVFVPRGAEGTGDRSEGWLIRWTPPPPERMVARPSAGSRSPASRRPAARRRPRSRWPTPSSSGRVGGVGLGGAGRLRRDRRRRGTHLGPAQRPVRPAPGDGHRRGGRGHRVAGGAARRHPDRPGRHRPVRHRGQRTVPGRGQRFRAEPRLPRPAPVGQRCDGHRRERLAGRGSPRRRRPRRRGRARGRCSR